MITDKMVEAALEAANRLALRSDYPALAEDCMRAALQAAEGAREASAGERERFEAWAQTQCASVSMYGNLYLEPNTQAAWLAWQARAALDAPRSGDTPVAWQVRTFMPSNGHSEWEACTPELAETVRGKGYYYGRRAEVRDLYAAPVSAPADARDAEIAALRAFANDVIGEREQFDPDIQELAEQHGLLVLVTVTESCGGNCECAEVGFPSECYRKTSVLRPAIDRAIGAEGGNDV